VVHEKRFVLTRTGGRARVAVVAPCTHGEVAILFERVVDRLSVVLVDHVDRRRTHSFLTRSLPAVLFACLGGLLALAYASQPNPVWPPAVYDMAAEDDAVDRLIDTTAVGGRPLLPIDVARLVLRWVPLDFLPARAEESALGFCLRSPPIA
jgi:hypothetical protein